MRMRSRRSARRYSRIGRFVECRHTHNPSSARDLTAAPASLDSYSYSSCRQPLGFADPQPLRRSNLNSRSPAGGGERGFPTSWACASGAKRKRRYRRTSHARRNPMHSVEHADRTASPNYRRIQAYFSGALRRSIRACSPSADLATTCFSVCRAERCWRASSCRRNARTPCRGSR